MGIDINTNVMAMNAYSNLSANEMNMQGSLAKLSSGYKINTAADDASGLVISQHLKAQLGGFQTSQANTQNAISVVQTAEGALTEVSNILQRIRSLAVQAANTSATDSNAQNAAQSEVTQSLATIDSIAQSTVFGTNKLLWTGTGASGTTVSFTFQVGYASTNQVSFSLTVLSTDSLGVSGINVSSAPGTAIDLADAAITTVATMAGTLGSYQNEFQHLANSSSVMQQNLSASVAGITDTDMAAEMVNFTKSQILVQAGVSMLAQANSTPQSILKLLG